MKEANKIAENIIDISDIDVFKNTRKREYIEVRSLLTFMLRHHCNMTYHQIKDFYKSKGKSYDHATAIHSLKAFETHRRYNRNLDKYFDLVLLVWCQPVCLCFLLLICCQQLVPCFLLRFWKF